MLKSQDVWPLVLNHLDIVCLFAFQRMPEGDITGEQSAEIWQAVCDKAGAHLWMDMEAFLFQENALIPRPIAGLIQDLQRFPNFEKILCYQYSGIFNSPQARVQPGGSPTVVLYRDYLQYRQNIYRNNQAKTNSPGLSLLLFVTNIITLYAMFIWLRHSSSGRAFSLNQYLPLSNVFTVCYRNCMKIPSPRSCKYILTPYMHTRFV